MGQDDEQRDTPVVGYLIVASRVPVGLLGGIVVVLFFAAWFALETTVALVAFPVAAVTANQQWIKQSWLGRFPIAYREFSNERFKFLRVIWNWVTDPAQAVDLNVEVGGGISTSAEQKAPTTPEAAPEAEPAPNSSTSGGHKGPTTHAAQDSWLEAALGFLGWAVIIGVVVAVIKGCSE